MVVDKRLIEPEQETEAPPSPEAKVRLLEAAEDHFGDHGFAGASLRSICQSAGVNLASVKYYFGDKEGLYIAAVKNAHQCNSAVELSNDFPHDAPPREQLRVFIQHVAYSMCAPTRVSAMKLMMRELADPGKAAHIVVQEFIQPMAFALREILRRLLPGTDEPRLLMTGFSIIGQILYYRQNRPVSELIFGKPSIDGLSPAMVADHVTQFTFAALGLDLSPSPAEGEGGQRGGTP
jgi:TetR/AcrR family transcriptional regulator, regulator of cefoperazone and chloramphenicol sensitivity